MSAVRNKVAYLESAESWRYKSQLLHAILSDDFKKVTSLIDDGVDVDTRIYHGGYNKPAVCICIESRHLEMAKVLIQRGCSLSLANGCGQMPLHVAVLHNDYNFVRYLIENRAAVNVKDNALQTPLHVACYCGSYDVAVALVEGGSITNINAADMDKSTPLSIACSTGKPDIANYLIEKRAFVNCIDRHGNSPLAYAVTTKLSLDLVNLLLERGADVNHENRNGDNIMACFLDNVCFGYPSTVGVASGVMKALLDAGCKTDICNSRGQNALHLAINVDHIRLVQQLINYGCDVNKTDSLGHSPIFYACRFHSLPAANLLIAAGIKWEQEQWLRVGNLKSYCSVYVVNHCIEKSTEWCSLAQRCRSVIRKRLAPDIENSVKQLGCPPLLEKYIILDLCY